jgi:hypothetical protein
VPRISPQQARGRFRDKLGRVGQRSMGEANWKGWRLLWLAREGNIRNGHIGCGGSAAAPTAERAENEPRHGGNGGLLTFGRLDHGGRGDGRACPEGLGAARHRRGGRSPASSAYPANPSWPAYLREIEVGVPLFGVQLLPIAVRPDGSRALSRIRAKSGQTFAESPGEAYLAARRSCLLGALSYFFWGAGACVVLH